MVYIYILNLLEWVLSFFTIFNHSKTRQGNSVVIDLTLDNSIPRLTFVSKNKNLNVADLCCDNFRPLTVKH